MCLFLSKEISSKRRKKNFKKKKKIGCVLLHIIRNWHGILLSCPTVSHDARSYNRQLIFLFIVFQEWNGWRSEMIFKRTWTMGNSNSQHQVLSPQWAHSYPRPRPIPPHIKVLPERVAPLKLRTTDNGAILQNGGTISGRKPVST